MINTIKYPKISIITPSFNQGIYLEDTINSILSQQYQNLEYIVIDGGSTDNSIEILKKYQKYITYWISEKDFGQSNAINKGLNRSSGKILTWVNSDDILQPGILKKIPSYFNDNDVGLVFGKSISFGVGIQDKLSDNNIENLNSQILGKVVFPQPASFFRREVFLNQGLLDESLHFGMDYDLFVRIALNFKIKSIEDVVSKNRYHPESKSISQTFNFASDWARVFSRVLRSFEFTDALIDDLKSLKIYQPGSDYYKVSRHYDINDINIAYLYFLKEQAQLYYGAFNLPIALKIVQRIKYLDINFYHEFKLDQIYFRSKFIPSTILKSLKFANNKIFNKNYGW